MDIVGCCQRSQHQSCNVLCAVWRTAIKWRGNSPLVATSSIDMPRSWAMNPSTENTAKPAKILVALFKQHRAMQSLQQKKTWHDDPSLQNVKPQLIISMWVRPLTCSSCCCIGCSLQVRWVLPDTQRRRRTPESRHHATPAGGKILTFEFVYSYIWNLVVGITCATVLTAWWVMTLCFVFVYIQGVGGFVYMTICLQAIVLTASG